MKMIYQKDETEKPLGKTKIGGVEFGYKLIEDGTEMPEGWRSHADIVNGEEAIELTEEQKDAAVLAEAKQAMQVDCLKDTGFDLDKRNSLEDMQIEYDNQIEIALEAEEKAKDKEEF